MSALPIWACEFRPIAGEAALNELTVGSKVSLECHGDIEVAWTQAPLQVTFPQKEDEFKLAVLQSTELSPKSASLIVTGYRAGKHEPEYLRIVQGENGFEISKPKWEIQSVIKQGDQPVPPFGPWNLQIPVWVFGAFLFFVLMVGYLSFRALRKHSQRRRMLADLALHKTALSPIHQFYRDARNLRRRLNNAKSESELKAVAEDLNRDFKLYILRRFQIPTLDWTTGAILADLRKRHGKVYRESSDTLKKVLRELGRAGNLPVLLLADLEQLHRMSLDSAERLENSGVKR